jgi:hypothetical protein
MGRYIDPDQPMSDEVKEWLQGRSRGDEVIENERRFPPGGEPAEHEAAGSMPSKVGYDYKTQAEKTEDAVGRPIEQLPTNDKGHPLVPEYGYDDDGDIDDDILDKVMDMTVDDLKAGLKKLGKAVSGNKEELIDRLANALQDQREEADKKES